MFRESSRFRKGSILNLTQNTNESSNVCSHEIRMWTAIYDGLGFGANFKRHIKKRKVWFRLISQLMKFNVVLERLQWNLKLGWDFS